MSNVDRWIKQAQKRLRLEDYDIEYDPLCPMEEDDHLAEIGYNMEHPSATIALKPGVKVTEELILHEVAHLLFARMRPFVVNTINAYVTDSTARQVLKDTVFAEEEQIVNRLVRALNKEV